MLLTLRALEPLLLNNDWLWFAVFDFNGCWVVELVVKDDVVRLASCALTLPEEVDLILAENR